MKVAVDQIKCKSTGICVKLCPEVFHFKIGNKKAEAINGEISTQFLNKCLEAQKKCPEEAIKVSM